ncbi:MAG TPA: agmatine deiminase family protein, partial [Candidatus Krumholzibacteria bacterium]|nr:agmatine deiminase family protein [Candidatus Krumholzibacteria bacterium]
IAEFFYDYYGVDTYNVLPDIQLDGIHHIDCWAKFLDEETVLVKKVASNHPDYNRVEANAAVIAALPNKYGRPFKVVRMSCPPIQSGNVAAYTNSLILNRKVLMPAFGIADDPTALQTYQNAMPGYEVLSFTGGWLTDDALHCRVMQIHDRYMLRVDHNPLQGSPPGVPMEVSVYLDDRSEAGIDMAQTKLYWRPVGAPAFNAVQLQSDVEPDWYRAQIPSQAPGAQIEYYITARDDTGRMQTRPRTAPVATYKVTAGGTTDVKPSQPPKLTFAVGPSPFRYQTTGRFHLERAGEASVSVYDVRGRQIATLLRSPLPAGDHSVSWNGKHANGAEAPSGVYFVVLKSAGDKITRRVVRLR